MTSHPTPDPETWDLLVVGGGTAGIVGATTAAQLGARVLLVERERTGGDCLWTGCVPSKALVAVAATAAATRAGERFGVRAEGVSIDFTAVMAHVHDAIAAIAPVDSPAALESKGVRVRTGDLRFTGPGTARIDGGSGPAQGELVRFHQVLLATGAAPAVPDLPGLAQADVLTSETVWSLTELPDRLLVLGGGSIGCELGQAFARLGSTVTVLEAGDRLLAREDPAASSLVHDALVADGVEVRLGARVASVEHGGLTLADGSRVEGDRVLVATGRSPRTGGLGLETLGVDLDPAGQVVVDEQLRTTAEGVWAAGDLTPHPRQTHVAGVHGSLAASNAVLGVRRRVDVVVPRVTYTRPEVAALGASTASPPAGHRVVEERHEHLDRAVAEGRTDGLTRIVLDRRGRVVGATVVGPRAGESLGELGLAAHQGLRLRDLAAVTHAYPTWNDAVWNAAVADLRGQLAKPAVGGTLRAATRARRWWLARRG